MMTNISMAACEVLRRQQKKPRSLSSQSVVKQSRIESNSAPVLGGPACFKLRGSAALRRAFCLGAADKVGM